MDLIRSSRQSLTAPWHSTRQNRVASPVSVLTVHLFLELLTLKRSWQQWFRHVHPKPKHKTPKKLMLTSLWIGDTKGGENGLWWPWTNHKTWKKAPLVFWDIMWKSQTPKKYSTNIKHTNTLHVCIVYIECVYVSAYINLTEIDILESINTK